MGLRVQDWRYDDGYAVIPEFLRKSRIAPTYEFREELKGWHCWAYETEGTDISVWMENNMSGPYECVLRFNDGDFMFTLKIENDEDATLFKLTWM